MYTYTLLIVQCLMLCLANTFFSLDEKEDVLPNTVKYEDDYAITFYPEGGFLLLKTGCFVAFTVVKSDRSGERVTGKIVDMDGNDIQLVTTMCPGLGYFNIYAMPGKKYQLVCENGNGLLKTFELPASIGRGYGIKTVKDEDRVFVSIAKPDDMPLRDSLYLVVQFQDTILHHELWDNAKEFVSFNRLSLPDGIVRFLLLDKSDNFVSERLVFNSIDKIHKPSSTFNLTNSIDSIVSCFSGNKMLSESVLDVFMVTTNWQTITSGGTGSDNDIWKTINLDGVIINGARINKQSAGMYSSSIPSSRTITQEEIDKYQIRDMASLLYRFGGVTMIGDNIYIRRIGATSILFNDYTPPLIVIDDMPYLNCDLARYPTSDIEEIFILKGADADTFGPKAQNGIIVIRTKRGTFK